MHPLTTNGETARVRPFATSVGALVAALLLVGCGKESSEQAGAPVHPKRVRQTEKVVIGLLHPKAATKPEKKIVKAPRPRIPKKRILEFALKPAQSGALVDLSKSAAAGLLEARLLGSPKLAWVERTNFDKVLQEQELQAAFGADAAAQRVRLGKLVKADLMVLVRAGKSPEDKPGEQLDLVVFETQRGLRLWNQPVPLSQDAEADAAELEALVNKAIAKQAERISDVCAVPPFVSNDLEYRFDYLKGAFGRALGQHLFGRQGVLLVEIAEAQAISKELALTDPGASLERRLPLYFLGEYRGAGVGDERRLSIGLRLMRGQKEVGARSRSGLTVAEAPRVLCELADELADKELASGPPESDPETEVEQLNQRAAMLQKFGAWEESLALLEASLLLIPDQKATRERALLACEWLVKKQGFQARTDPKAGYALIAMFRRAIDHHEIYVRPTQPADPPWNPRQRTMQRISEPFGQADFEFQHYDPPTSELAALRQEARQAQRDSLIRIARWRAHAQYGDEVLYVHMAAGIGWSLPESVALIGKMVLEFQDLPWPKERTLRLLRGGLLAYQPREEGPVLEHLAQVGNESVKQVASSLLPEFRKVQAEREAARAKFEAERARKAPALKDKRPLPEASASREVEFRPVELFWEAPNGKQVAIPRIIGCLPLRENLDLVLADRALFLMRQKGHVRLVWTGKGYLADSCYDGRYVWFVVTEGYWTPLSLFVLDPESGKKWQVTDKDGVPQAATKELARIDAFQSLKVAPLGPGKVCLAGSFGRTWIALATFDPGKGASVKVIHEARELQDNKEPDQGKRTTVAYKPLVMHTLASKPDASGRVAQRVLIARGQMLAPYGHWPPLVVDPVTSAVEVADPLFRIGILEKSRSHEGAVYGWIDKGDNKPSHVLFRISYPAVLNEVWPSVPAQGHIRLVGDRLNIIGDKWWTGSLARKELHPVRDMPPEVDDVFPSAHYGLIFSSFDRSNKKFTTYQVIFNNK